MIGVSARRLLARAVGFAAVDPVAVAAAREAWGSWRRLGDALRAEKLAPLFGYRLATGEECPGDDAFKEAMKAEARAALAFNLLHRKKFEDVRRKLSRAGIPALPIKGVDVAFASFPHPSCRPLSDVDVLVSPDNYLAAQEVLRQEGFVPLRRDPRWWPGRSYARAGEVVDLHWSPAAALPPRRGMVSLVYIGAREDVIRDEFRLLVSVCHHQNHFFSLPLLYFWETAHLGSRVSWADYAPLARRWGAARATQFVLALARVFFGTEPLPEKFNFLKLLAGPALAGKDVGRGARAAATYAFSLDNPAAAAASAFRRPAWARTILTRHGRNGE